MRKFCGLMMICGSVILSGACQKKEIQFGDALPESFTRLLSVDTVTPFLSTIVPDSFPTSGNKIMHIGRCIDPLMGTTSAQTFFQIGLPDDAKNGRLPDDAVYDSLVLVIRPAYNWYGDTSKPMTFIVHELAEQPDYTYANRIFNTSSFPWMPAALASVNRNLSPARDSLTLKLTDTKGQDMFGKIREKDAAFQDAEAFLNYFKGFTVKVAPADDGAVYNFKTDSNTVMRLYYHTTYPYYEKHHIDFYCTNNSYQFNNILTDRTGTALEKMYDGQEEYFPTDAHPYAISQAGTGVMLKVKFPSLQDIKTIGKTIKLLSALLVLKPVEDSFDPFHFPLSRSLFAAQTNATNIIGETLSDITGQGILSASPVIDEVYRLNTNYTYDVTHYISYLLSLNNSAETGMFILEEYPGSTTLLNRAVIGNKQNPKWRSQLKLTLLTTPE